MIKQDESGLSPEEYAALLDAETGATFQVIAHKYNLDFQEFSINDNALDNDSDAFDAIVFQSKLIHAIGAIVGNFNLSTGLYTTESYPFEYTYDAAPSLVAIEDDVIYHFQIEPDGIKRSQSVDAAEWTDLETVYSSSFVIHISSTHPNRVHFVLKDTDKNVYQLCCAEKISGFWEIVTSTVYWMYPIQSFKAVVSDEGHDVIAFVSHVPGTVAVSAVNNIVTKKVEPTTAIISFKYRDYSWSDHFAVETIDNAKTYRYRRGVNLSRIGDTLFLTCFAVDGSADHNFGFFRLYTSMNGRNWSMGRILPMLESSGYRGVKLLRHNEYVYAIQRQTIYRSLSTLLTGYSPPANQFDITESIQEYSITYQGSWQVALLLENANGIYNNHPVINKDNVISLVHYIGYSTDPEMVPMVQVAITEVDSLQFKRELPVHTVRISARDRMSWLSDKSQSEQPHYWESQLIGGDEYQDNTGTGYGGLRHTAQESGSWMTPAGVLELRSSDVEGISFDTQSPYIWNGSKETIFTLSIIDNDEYAGVVFRALDKDNLWGVFYNQSDDKLYLFNRISGAQSNLWSGDELGWKDFPTTPRGIRVEFRYALIRFYISNDGVYWLLAGDYIQPGAGDPGQIVVAPLDMGSVGQIGKGFNPADEWSEEEDEEEEDTSTTIPDPDGNPPGDNNEETETTDDPPPTGFDPSAQNIGLLTRRLTNVIGITKTLSAHKPTWWSMPSPSGTVLAACWNESSSHILSGAGALGAYILCKNGSTMTVYSTNDILGKPIIWTARGTWTEADAVLRANIRHSASDYLRFGVGYRTSTQVKYRHTADNGLSWVASASHNLDKFHNLPNMVGYDLQGGDHAHVRIHEIRDEVNRHTLYYAALTGAFDNLEGGVDYRWQSGYEIPMRVGDNVIYACLYEYEVGEEENANNIPGVTVEVDGTTGSAMADGSEINEDQTVTQSWEFEEPIEVQAIEPYLFHSIWQSDEDGYVFPAPPIGGEGLSYTWSVKVIYEDDTFLEETGVYEALEEDINVSYANFGHTAIEEFRSDLEEETDFPVVKKVKRIETEITWVCPELFTWSSDTYQRFLSMGIIFTMPAIGVGGGKGSNGEEGWDDVGLGGGHWGVGDGTSTRLFRISNLSGSPVWTNVTPTIGSNRYPIVYEITSAPGSDSKVAVLAINAVTGDLQLFVSSTSGDLWTPKSGVGIGREIKRIYINEDEDVYLVGDSRLELLFGSRISKMGNLKTLWGAFFSDLNEVITA